MTTKLTAVLLIVAGGCAKPVQTDWVEKNRKAQEKLDGTIKGFHEDAEALRQEMQKLSDARARLLFPENFQPKNGDER